MVNVNVNVGECQGTKHDGADHLTGHREGKCRAEPDLRKLFTSRRRSVTIVPRRVLRIETH
jgi:hypothetical protein